MAYAGQPAPGYGMPAMYTPAGYQPQPGYGTPPQGEPSSVRATALPRRAMYTDFPSPQATPCPPPTCTLTSNRPSRCPRASPLRARRGTRSPLARWEDSETTCRLAPIRRARPGPPTELCVFFAS